MSLPAFPLNRSEERDIVCAVEHEILARYLKFAAGKLACTEENNWARNEKHGLAPMIFWGPTEEDQRLCVNYLTFMYAQYVLIPMGDWCGSVYDHNQRDRNNGCEKG